MTAIASESSGAGRLILASASPRRQSLLREAGYQFEIHPADIDEENFGAGLGPAELAQKLAIAKAQAVAELFPEDVVLGADTVVAFGEQILGKAHDADHARRILSLLEGTTHIAITGVAIIRKSESAMKSTRVMSAVRMKNLTARQIDEYIASNEWKGKAGAYGIQDKDPFVARLSGCLTNIVGLPMPTVAKLLDAFGVYPRL